MHLASSFLSYCCSCPLALYNTCHFVFEEVLFVKCYFVSLWITKNLYLYKHIEQVCI